MKKTTSTTLTLELTREETCTLLRDLYYIVYESGTATETSQAILNTLSAEFENTFNKNLKKRYKPLDKCSHTC